MKTGPVLCISLSVALISASGLHTFAQSQQADFDLRLRLGERSIYPFEPLSLVSTLQNRTIEAKRGESTWTWLIFIREGETGPWKVSGRPGPVAAPPVASPIVLEPGEGLANFGFLTIGSDGMPLFAKPGIYWVKAKFYDLNLESELQRLEVRTPVGIDSQACQYVREHSLYRYFEEQTANACLSYIKGSSDPTKELEALVSLFPESRYAQWGKLAGLLIREYKAGHDRKNLEAVQTDMEQLAPNLSKPINAMCWQAAGAIAKMRGNTASAETDFNRALATNPDAVIRFQIGRAIRELKGASWKELRRSEPREFDLR